MVTIVYLRNGLILAYTAAPQWMGVTTSEGESFMMEP